LLDRISPHFTFVIAAEKIRLIVWDCRKQFCIVFEGEHRVKNFSVRAAIAEKQKFRVRRAGKYDKQNPKPKGRRRAVFLWCVGDKKIQDRKPLRGG